MGLVSARRKSGFVAFARHFPGMDKTVIETTPAPWRDLLLLCGKCSRKLDGGFGKKERHDLKDVLRDALKAAGRRRELRVLEVGCLGLCPKRAITAINTARPGEVLVVPRGADPASVLTVLGASAR